MAQVQQELFTDLSNEQAATLEGGLTFTLKRVHALRTGSDAVGRDEAKLFVNGTRRFGAHKMSAGDVVHLNRSFNIGGSGAVRLFDEDPGRDDYIDGFNVYARTSGYITRNISNGKSSYDITFSVS